MNEQTWDAVPFGPDLAQDALALCQRTWGAVEITDARYQRWQYAENPAGPAFSTFARARDGGRLVGQFGAVPLRFIIDGEERVATLALNVVTDADHRHRGVFVGLGRAADERMAAESIAHAWALPNENSFPGFIRHLGYEYIGDVPLVVRPVNVRRLVSRRLPVAGVGELAAVLARALAPALPDIVPPAPGIDISRIDRFGDEFDAFWQRIRGRHGVVLVRDARYLNWRFRDIPIRRYECFAASEGGEATGYVSLRLAEIAGMKAGLIVDFVTANERAGEALLSQALAFFSDHDIDLLASLMLPHTCEYRLLRRARFWPLPRPLLPQRFRVVARGDAAFRDLSSWFLTMGDYDVV